MPVSQVKLLGELYNGRVLHSTTIFNILFDIICVVRHPAYHPPGCY